jgi:RNA polymerase sigma-70 factor (ECF subfamily)
MSNLEQFETFMRNYQNMVFSTAVRLLGNESDASDIAQEVFLKAYDRFEELQQSPTAGGWLKTVARNLSLNHLTRYRNRWRFFSEMFQGDEGEEDRPADIQDPNSPAPGFGEGTDAEMLEQALSQLPVNFRVPLVLYHFEGLDYAEIAAQLKISLGKVKTDILRGREALRKKLRRGADGEVEWQHRQVREESSPSSESGRGRKSRAGKIINAAFI